LQDLGSHTVLDPSLAIDVTSADAKFPTTSPKRNSRTFFR